ncbi:MAG: bifunctional serine/threonine-protein kinase/formylglycine-generating enzyme family protein [Planctomycetota bacterium]
MEGDTKKPPPFFCPSCGQKHRAPIDNLVANPGAVLRVACSACTKPLAVTLNADGSLACVLVEEGAAPPDPPAASTPAATTAAAPAATASTSGAPTPSAPRSTRRGKGGKDRSAGPKRDAPVRKGKRSTAGRKTAAPLPASQDSAAAQASAPESPAVPAPAGPGAPKPARTPPAPADDVPAVAGAEFAEGDHVGRYLIEHAIAEGGTSVVYRAFDPTTNRTVALKVLKTGLSDAMRERFLREIEVQANIRHQNIMPVFDRGALPDGRPFFTMELLYRPITLEEIADRRLDGTLSKTASLRPLLELEGLVKAVLVPVSEGVYVANVENGVIHRDLKPGNVLVDSRTLRPYVIDFGICHALEKKGAAGKAVVAPTTEDAGVVGTPRFLAPEQVTGSVHARTDVWGLGALLRYAVTGEPPIAGAASITRAELGRRLAQLREARASAERKGEEGKIELIEEKLARLEEPGLRTIDDIFRDARDARYTPLPVSTPSPVVAVINKSMAANPTDRYVNARQLVADLSSWLEGGSVRALREVGGKAAAVESARRALQRHLMTAVVALVGLVGGFFVGKLVAGAPQAAPSTRVADVEVDVESLERHLERMRLALAADRLTPLEQRLLFETLAERQRAFQTRLGGEPDVPRVRSVRERMQFVTNRFAPALVFVDLPEGAKAQARCRLVGFEGAVELAAGPNRLPPGLYDVDVQPGDIRIPLSVPLLVRESSLEAQPDKEPAWTTLRLPVTPSSIPRDVVLVAGGRVKARDLPFGPASPEEAVEPFFLGRAEVTNLDYATWLRALAPEARAKHAPLVGITVGPEDGGVQVTTGADSRPVVGIRPSDARAYAAWRAERDGVPWRLPTEAEWVLAAGGALGYTLPGGLAGEREDAHLIPPLADAGGHARDISPYGARGMLGNAREMVTPSIRTAAEGDVIVKGAGVGEAPDAGAIHAWRVLGVEDREPATGLRLARDLTP